MGTSTETESRGELAGQKVTFVGRLAGMSKRDAQQLVRRHGGQVVEKNAAAVDLIVVGDGNSTEADLLSALDAPLRRAVECNAAVVFAESQLWQRLGLVESQQHLHRLYTPAMLAGLLGVPVTLVRRWHRRGLIVAAREVRKLAYFDFREVAVARRLAELFAAGVSPAAIERKLDELARRLPGVARPLAELSVVVVGKRLLLRTGEGLAEPGGQLRLDFDADEAAMGDAGATAPAARGPNVVPLGAMGRGEPLPSVEEIVQLAAKMEDENCLEAAAEMYRAALAAGGPNAEICFRLAEVLYQQGEHSAARERYYAAIETDEDYVEARANLGCVLAEGGQLELAVAAFEGALAYHPDYADAHFHLAQALERLGRHDDALEHWETFLALAPDSPWADEALARIESP